MQINLEVRAEPAAASRARAALDPLRDVLDDELVDDLRLLVTELVTNSYRYAREGVDPIQLRVVTGRTPRVHVEVIDRGPGFTAPAVFDKPDESGWGLRLLTELADRWGVQPGTPTVVWFEIDPRMN